MSDIAFWPSKNTSKLFVRAVGFLESFTQLSHLKSGAEHAIPSKTDTLFANLSIGKLMKRSNFYKEGGIQCVVVLKEIFGLVFSGKNLFRTLKMNPDDISFKKTTAYRFLNSSSFNWARLLLLLVTRIIGAVSRLTSEDRVNVLIVDDSLYDRSRNKKVELLSIY